MLPTTITDALLFFEQITSVRPYYELDDEPLVTNLLENSKAPDATDTVYYRVYWVAGYFLSQVPRIHELSKAEDGVTFTGLAVPIKSNFLIQQAKDAEMGLIVPPGMEADPCALTSCGSGSSGGGSTPGSVARPFFGTMSVPVRVSVGGL